MKVRLLPGRLAILAFLIAIRIALLPSLAGAGEYSVKQCEGSRSLGVLW